MLDDDTELFDVVVTQSLNEFVNTVHGYAT